MKKILLTILTISFFISCNSSNKMIKGTNIPNTETNQAIISLIKKYNNYLEKMDINGLLSVASKNYYDNAGTQDSKDDYSYSQLETIFKERFKNIKEIHQKIKINFIKKDTENTYIVNYSYEGRFLIQVDSSSRWFEKKDFNELTIIKVNNDEFKFLNGM